jgi:hypothetical protein
MFRIVLRLLALAVFVVPAAAFAGTAQARAAADAYTVNPLVSDSSATPAAATDPSLVNAWGLSVGPTTPRWVTLTGTDGPGFTITMNKKSVAAGKYVITIHDRSSIHNFHFVCDPHRAIMHGILKVM